jgi:uncharacterized protein YaiL (DUF2058 family)
MLDLKNQLLKAGLVTEDQVEKVEKEEADKRAKRKAARDKAKSKNKGGKGKGPRGKGKGGNRGRGGKSDAQLWKERIAKLQAGGKAEQYDAIRSWVKRHRLDPDGGLPSDNAERFHFEKDDGGISWLTIEPDLKAKVTSGEAGIVAYMSNHGLTHVVVPRNVAEDIGKLRPEWVRSLKGWVAVARKEAEETPPPSEGETPTKPQASSLNPKDSPVADGELGLADGEGQDAAVGDDKLVVAEEPKDDVVSGDLKD